MEQLVLIDSRYRTYCILYVVLRVCTCTTSSTLPRVTVLVVVADLKYYYLMRVHFSSSYEYYVQLLKTFHKDYLCFFRQKVGRLPVTTLMPLWCFEIELAWRNRAFFLAFLAENAAATAP